MRRSRPTTTTGLPGTIYPYAAGTSNSANVRLTRQKSALFQWLAVPLWFPTDKDSLPTDSGGIPFERFSTRRPASSPALGESIHKLTNTPSTGSERLTRFSIVCSASRCRHSARDALGGSARSMTRCAPAFSNATPPTVRTALTISRPQCMVRPCVARDFRRSVGFGSRINVSGLILEHVLRAIMDISARAFLLAARPQLGHSGHQGSHAPGRPSSISSQSLADLGGETGCDVMSSLAPYRCSSFVRAMRPFLRPGVRLKSGSARRGRQGWPSRLARLGRRRFQATP
jgi:hypothetical protein